MSDRAQVETTVSHRLVVPEADVRAALIKAGYPVPDGEDMLVRLVTGEQFEARRSWQLGQVEFHWRGAPR